MAHGTGDEPIHLNNHHLNTLTAIFSHPTSHNIRWADVISLLEHVGDVDERHDGRLKITVGAETEVFDRPRHKDIDTQMVVDLRRMLRNAGFDPKTPGQEV
ncbi:MAG: type II toxin-antitoxin system HicA family toxin [Actinobacteria bacterium]|nr:type II toxin-antitoxin system HicA family toxin [Actinomycetota bacterium]